MCFSYMFVCFGRVNFCPFSLPVDVKGLPQLVIVAFPGLFY